ncbi:MAG: phospholipase D-like domain-containing protein [Candidatus Micrarchaeota archaeon]
MDSRTFFLALVIGAIIGYSAYGALNPAPCGIPASAYCLNGLAENLISPGAKQDMLAAINSAEKSIHIILYEFSYSDLKEALVNARKRGVEVKLILEPKVDQNLDTADFLKSKGIEVKWASSKFNNSHAKTAIIDGKRVITGSLNWSRNAMERNREIGAIIDNERMAQELENVFESDWSNGSEVK